MTSTPHLQHGAAWSWRIYSLQSVLRCRPTADTEAQYACGTSSRSNLTTGSRAPKWRPTSPPTPHRPCSVSFVAVCGHMLNLRDTALQHPKELPPAVDRLAADT